MARKKKAETTVETAAEEVTVVQEEEKPSQKGTVKTATGVCLNLRKTPGGAVIGLIPNGTEVEILEDKGEWLLIKSGKTQAYVVSKFIV